MQKSYGDARSSKRGQKRKRRFAPYLRSDDGLLMVFLAAVCIVSISILIVPFTLEESQADYLLAPAQYEHHSLITRHKNISRVVKQTSKQNSVDTKISSTSSQKDDVSNAAKQQQSKQQNSVDAKNSSTASQKDDDPEGYFLTHSTQYHTIFSTACSVFQDWQSYVFFYNVVRSGQEGHITRIASGCKDEDAVKLQEMFAKEITSMRPDPNHHLHLTPDFSRIPKENKKPFKYFNKPFGVRHWMEHALGYPENHELHDDSIIILMDPDQIMLRPFTNDFTNSSEKWRSIKKRKLKVEHGSAFAQQYGYGMQWLDKVKLENIFQGNNFPTPVSNMTEGPARRDAMHYYVSMGPVSKSASHDALGEDEC